MITLTLTQTENGSAVVTPECNIVFGTEWYDTNINQFELEAVDGTDIIYSAGGPLKVHGLMLLKNLSYSDGLELLEWIRDDLDFAYNRFTISAVTNTDLGLGKNTAITNARWDGGSSLRDVFEYVAPGIFNVKFPYRFIRS